MKKILFIMFDLNIGGAERVLIDTLNAFDYDKYEVTLLLVNKEGSFIEELDKRVKIKWLFNHVSSTLLIKLFYHPFISQFIIKRVIKNSIKERYDTIISYVEGPSAVCHSYIMDMADNNVSFIHCDLSNFFWTQKMYKSEYDVDVFYRSMSKVVFISEGVMNGYIKRFGNIDNGIVIHNISDEAKVLDLAKRDNYEKKGFTVCCLGRLNPVKRFDKVIYIASVLRNKGAKVYFDIVGNGVEYAKLKSLIEEYNLKDIVYLRGYDNNPYKYLNSADMLLITSDSEGHSMVAREAMILGKPILSTPNSGCKDLLEGGGGIISTFEVDDLAEVIYRLYNSNEELSHLSADALEKSKCYSTAQLMSQLYSVI